MALDEVDFSGYLDMPLHEVRDQIGLEKDLILAYYHLEKRRYPSEPECQRLLDRVSQTVEILSNQNKHAM